MAGNLISLLPVMIVIFLILLLLFFMHDKPERFFFFLVCYFVLDSSTLFELKVIIRVEDINIFPEDLLTILLALEFFSSLSNRNLPRVLTGSKYRIVGKTFLLLSIFGLITWTYSRGIQTAVVNWRENLLDCFLILYCFSLKSWLNYRFYSSVIFRSSLFLSVMILARIAIHGIGNFSQLSNDTRSTDRATTAAGALFLLFALWNYLIQIHTLNLKNFFYILMIVGEILILQHRSVWVALLIGVMFLLWKLNIVELRFRIVALSLIIAPILFLAVRSSPILSSAASDSGTLTWRILRWQGSLEQSKSFVQILIGSVFGNLDQITVAGLSVAAHNMYITLFEKFGIVGVILYLSLLIPHKKLNVKKMDHGNIDSLMTITLIAFGFFYSFPYIAIIVFFALRRIRSQLYWEAENSNY